MFHPAVAISASVSSGGRDLFIGRSRQKIKQELASPNGSKIEGIVRNKLEPVFSFSASSVEILPEGDRKVNLSVFLMLSFQFEMY